MNLKVVILLMSWSGADLAYAEGGCPQGQYPYETPQARQCVPIPGDGESVSSQSEAVYENRWGAVATDPGTGETGVSVGETRKWKAKKVAMQRCAEGGSGACKVRFTFFNQCIAFAAGGKYRASATAESGDEAQARAMAKCANGNSADCSIIHSSCSLPERVR